MRYTLLNFSTLSKKELKAATQAIPEGTTILQLSGIDLSSIDLNKCKKFISELPPSIKELSFAGTSFSESEINSYEFERLIKYFGKIITAYDFRGCELTNNKIDMIRRTLKYSGAEMVYVDDTKISLEIKISLLFVLQNNINKKAEAPSLR